MNCVKRLQSSSASLSEGSLKMPDIEPEPLGNRGKIRVIEFDFSFMSEVSGLRKYLHPYVVARDKFAGTAVAKHLQGTRSEFPTPTGSGDQ